MGLLLRPSSTPFGLEKKLKQAPTARSSILAFRPRGFPRGSYSLSPTLTFLRPSSPPSPPPYATYDAYICTESTLAFSFSLQVQSFVAHHPSNSQILQIT